MILLLFLLTCQGAVHRPTTTARKTHAPTEDPATIIADCGGGVTFSRAQAIACLLDCVDTNHDGRIVPAEIEAVKSRYLNLVEQAMAKAGTLIGVGNMEQIMRDCDVNGDGAITYSDMVWSQDSCIPTWNDSKDHSKGKSDKMCYLKSYICDRASKALGHNTY